MMKSRGFSFTQFPFSKKGNEDISSLEAGCKYLKVKPDSKYGLYQPKDPKEAVFLETKCRQ